MTPPQPKRKPKYIGINRNQFAWSELDIDKLIGPLHPARAIWEISGRLDLSGFEHEIESFEGDSGRPCWPPRVMFCVWVYTYSLGIASSRAVERMMKHEPGLRWLTADQVINYASLSTFRTCHKELLENLMSQLLAILDEEELIDLRVIAVDGTKIRARASRHSLHREKTLKQRLAMAQDAVRKLTEQGEQDDAADGRKAAAEQRAAEERLQRMEASLQRLEQLQQKAKRSEREQVRVSSSEPEARNMKHPDGSWAPSYNVQISTDAKHKIIVGIHVSAAANDIDQLVPAVADVQQMYGDKPEQVLADGGYASRNNVAEMAEQEIELVSPWKQDSKREAGACAVNGIAPEFAPSAFQSVTGEEALVCPAGQKLYVIGERKKHGNVCAVFEAEADVCGRCAMLEACCGKGKTGPRRIERVVETPLMQAYLARMDRPEYQQQYKKRSEVGEFPHLWMKGHWNFRRFSVKGKANAAKEAIWAALTYNIEQWSRVIWRPQVIKARAV